MGSILWEDSSAGVVWVEIELNCCGVVIRSRSLRQLAVRAFPGPQIAHVLESSYWLLQKALQLNNQRWWIGALLVGSIDCSVDESRGTCQLATRTDNLTYSLIFLAVDHQRCVGLMNGEYPVGGFVGGSRLGGDRVELLWRRDQIAIVPNPPRPLAPCSLDLFHCSINLLVDGRATGTQQSTVDW